MPTLTPETQITKAPNSGIACLQRLIKHLQENNRVEYAMEVRKNYLVDNCLNFEAIIYKGSPMDLVCKQIDKSTIIKFIGYAISRCVKSFNVSKNMNEDQIIDMAVDWVESYSTKGSFDEPTIRIEEIIAFLELAKTGRYGQPFDRIDASVLQEWFEKYYKERRQVHYDNLDAKKYNPEIRTINENDRLDRALVSLAGKMGGMKNIEG